MRLLNSTTRDINALGVCTKHLPKALKPKKYCFNLFLVVKFMCSTSTLFYMIGVGYHWKLHIAIILY